MPSKLAYEIADDVIEALFTNGTKQRASHLVLELEGGRNGGGWSRIAAYNHIADLIEKRLASGGAVEHSVQRTCSLCGGKKKMLDSAGYPVNCPACGGSGTSR